MGAACFIIMSISIVSHVGLHLSQGGIGSSGWAIIEHGTGIQTAKAGERLSAANKPKSVYESSELLCSGSSVWPASSSIGTGHHTQSSSLRMPVENRFQASSCVHFEDSLKFLITEEDLSVGSYPRASHSVCDTESEDSVGRSDNLVTPNGRFAA